MKFICLIFGCLLILWPGIECSRTVNSAKECSRGPTFWCESLRNAAGCNAIKHCIDTVWTKSNIVTTSVCDTCLQMVTAAREELRNNMTKDEIKQVVEGVCQIYSLNVKRLEKLCEQYVNEYLDELLEMLYSNMDPDMICKIAQLCSLGSPCLQCNQFSNNLLTKFDDTNEKLRVDGLKSVAKKLCLMITNTNAVQCDTFINDNVNHLLKYVRANLMNNELCHLSSMCRVNAHSHADSNNDRDNFGLELISDSNSDECEMCKVIFKNIRDALVKNTTFVEFKTIAEKICYKMLKNNDWCYRDMDTYFKLIYDAIKDNSFVEMFCTMIELCNQKLDLQQIDTIKEKYQYFTDNNAVIVDQIVPDVRTMFDEMMTLNGENLPTNCEAEDCLLLNMDSSESIDDPFASDWNSNSDLLRSINMAIKDRSSNEEIKMPAEKKPIEFGDTIDSNRKLPIERMFINHRNLENLNNENVCQFCSIFVSFIQKRLDDNETIEKIKEDFQYVCQLLMPNKENICMKFMIDKFDNIISMLKANVEPTVICSKVCPRDDNVVPKSKKDCVMCLLFVESVKNFLDKNDTIVNIEKYIQQMCNSLQSNLRKDCEEFVAKYSTEIMKKIINGVIPKEACKEFNICSSNYLVYGDGGKRNSDCDVCQQTVQILYKRKHDASFNFSDMTQLSKVCVEVPKKNVEKCKDFVKSYGKSIVYLLLKMDLPSMKVCEKMGICAVTVLGSSECSYGPRFYLHDIDNAIKCDAHNSQYESIQEITNKLETFLQNAVTKMSKINNVEQYRHVISTMSSAIGKTNDTLTRIRVNSMKMFHLSRDANSYLTSTGTDNISNNVEVKVIVDNDDYIDIEGNTALDTPSYTYAYLYTDDDSNSNSNSDLDVDLDLDLDLDADTKSKSPSNSMSQCRSTPVMFDSSYRVCDVGSGSNNNFKNCQESPLIEACIEGHLINVKKLLANSTAQISDNSQNGESLILLASGYGHYEIVKELLLLGASVEDRGNRNNTTSLMEAASSGYLRIVELLIANGADPNAKSESKNTALIFASANGYKEIVEYLITHGSSLEDSNESGYNALLEASDSGHLEVVTILIKNGADVNYRSMGKHETALTLACRKGHYQIVDLLLRSGAGRDKEMSEIETVALDNLINDHILETFNMPLIMCASDGHLQIALLLIERGINMENLDDNYNTALMEACRQMHLEMVIVLLTQCVHVNSIRNNSSPAPTTTTTATAIPTSVPASEQETALTLACSTGSIMIAMLLLKAGANIELGEKTPLMRAAYSGQYEVVEFLIHHGADINAESVTHDTPLSYACENGHVKVVEILLFYGANIEHECEGGRTPLMKACLFGSLEIVKLLVKHKANVNKETINNEHTPLSLACASGHVQIVEFLLLSEADPYHKLKDNSTMIIEAVKGGYTEVAKMLIDYPRSIIDRDANNCNNDISHQNGYQEPKNQTEMNNIHNDNLNVMKNSNGDEDVNVYLSNLTDFNEQGNDNILNLDAKEPLFQMNQCDESALSKCPLKDFLCDDFLLKIDEDYNFENFIQMTENEINVATALEIIARDESKLSPFNNSSSTNDTEMKIEEELQKLQIFDEIKKADCDLDNLMNQSCNNTLKPLSSALAEFSFNFSSFMNSDTPGGVSTLTATSLANIQTTNERRLESPEISKSNKVYPEERQDSIQKATDYLINLAEKNDPVFHDFFNFDLDGDSNPTNKTFSEVMRTLEEFTLDETTDIFKGFIEALGNDDKIHQGCDKNVDENQAIDDDEYDDDDDNGNEDVDEDEDEDDDEDVEDEEEDEEGGNEVDVVQHTNSSNSLDSSDDSEIDEQSSIFFPEDLLEEEGQDKGANRRRVAVYNELRKYQKLIETTNKSVITQPNSSQIEDQYGVKCLYDRILKAQKLAKNKVHLKVRKKLSTKRLLTEVEQFQASITSIYVDSVTDTNNDTALTLSAAGGNLELVELLLSRGANIEHRDKKGFTPLIIAATSGHLNIVNFLLKKGADIEVQAERTRDSPLSLACSNGQYHVVELLLRRGANKEHRNISDYTPLSLAASGGYIDVIKLLLTYGAEINSRTGSKLGISPLMLAAMNGHTGAVRLLIDLGGDINAQIETNRNTALTLACFQGRSEVVKLLLNRKANIEHRAKTGLTPLMEAASGGFVKVGKLLIDRGAEINGQPVPTSRDTALTIAADKGHFEFVKLLVANGAIVEAKNKKGNSPLWLAANGGHLNVVEYLYKNGANIDSQDNRKISCLMAAFHKGHVHIVNWMVNLVSLFPPEDELSRYMNSDAVREDFHKYSECCTIIEKARSERAIKANEIAANLIKEIDMEKIRDDSRRSIFNVKRDKKSLDKKKKDKKDYAFHVDFDVDDEDFDDKLESEVHRLFELSMMDNYETNSKSYNCEQSKRFEKLDKHGRHKKTKQSKKSKKVKRYIRVELSDHSDCSDDSANSDDSNATVNSNIVQLDGVEDTDMKIEPKSKTKSKPNVKLKDILSSVQTHNRNDRSSTITESINCNVSKAPKNELKLNKKKDDIKTNQNSSNKEVNKSDNKLPANINGEEKCISNNNKQNNNNNKVDSHDDSSFNSNKKSKNKQLNKKGKNSNSNSLSSLPLTNCAKSKDEVNTVSTETKTTVASRSSPVVSKNTHSNVRIFDSSRSNVSTHDEPLASPVSSISSTVCLNDHSAQDDINNDSGWKIVEKKMPLKGAKKLYVSLESIPRIIGKSGKNINLIRSATGAQIEIEKQRKNQTQRTITIKGSSDVTKKAQLVIEAMVNDSKGDVHSVIKSLNLDIPVEKYTMQTKSTGNETNFGCVSGSSCSSSLGLMLTSTSKSTSTSTSPGPVLELNSDSDSVSIVNNMTNSSSANIHTTNTTNESKIKDFISNKTPILSTPKQHIATDTSKTGNHVYSYTKALMSTNLISEKNRRLTSVKYSSSTSPKTLPGPNYGYSSDRDHINTKTPNSTPFLVSKANTCSPISSHLVSQSSSLPLAITSTSTFTTTKLTPTSTSTTESNVPEYSLFYNSFPSIDKVSLFNRNSDQIISSKQPYNFATVTSNCIRSGYDRKPNFAAQLSNNSINDVIQIPTNCGTVADTNLSTSSSNLLMKSEITPVSELIPKAISTPTPTTFSASSLPVPLTEKPINVPVSATVAVPLLSSMTSNDDVYGSKSNLDLSHGSILMEESILPNYSLFSAHTDSNSYSSNLVSSPSYPTSVNNGHFDSHLRNVVSASRLNPSAPDFLSSIHSKQPKPQQQNYLQQPDSDNKYVPLDGYDPILLNSAEYVEYLKQKVKNAQNQQQLKYYTQQLQASNIWPSTSTSTATATTSTCTSSHNNNQNNNVSYIAPNDLFHNNVSADYVSTLNTLPFAMCKNSTHSSADKHSQRPIGTERAWKNNNSNDNYQLLATGIDNKNSAVGRGGVPTNQNLNLNQNVFPVQTHPNAQYFNNCDSNFEPVFDNSYSWSNQYEDVYSQCNNRFLNNVSMEQNVTASPAVSVTTTTASTANVATFALQMNALALTNSLRGVNGNNGSSNLNLNFNYNLSCDKVMDSYMHVDGLVNQNNVFPPLQSSIPLMPNYYNQNSSNANQYYQGNNDISDMMAGSISTPANINVNAISNVNVNVLNANRVANTFVSMREEDTTMLHQNDLKF